MFSAVPYVAVAWGYSYFTEGGQPAFMRAIDFLVAARVFFALIETLGGILAWRLFYRKKSIANFVEDSSSRGRRASDPVAAELKRPRASASV